MQNKLNEPPFGNKEQAELDAILTQHLPESLPAEPYDALQSRLMARVSRSIADHAALLTVRRNEGGWRALRTGVRFKPLWRSSEGSSVLIEMAPGCALPAHRHLSMEEGVVLRGSLQIGNQHLERFDYHLSPAGSRHAPIRSRDGVLAFLRGSSVGHTASELYEFLSGLLPFKGVPGLSVFDSENDWIEIAPGVEKKALWSDGVTASNYFRFAPGASVGGHLHRGDEECMMLDGDLFIGDILLRAGDYQLAPAGSRHGKVFSDNGALVYVRGAAKESVAGTIKKIAS